MAAINEPLHVRVRSNDIDLTLPLVNHGKNQKTSITKSVKPVSTDYIRLKRRCIRAFSETK